MLRLVHYLLQGLNVALPAGQNGHQLLDTRHLSFLPVPTFFSFHLSQIVPTKLFRSGSFAQKYVLALPRSAQLLDNVSCPVAAVMVCPLEVVVMLGMGCLFEATLSS